MSKFDNKLCPVCRKPFGGDDEIAVCPVCGTPHHRACYFLENKCAFEELHGGFVWNGRLPDEPEPEPEPVPEQIPLEGESSGDVMTAEGELLEQIEADPSVDKFFKSISDETGGVDGVSMRELIAYTCTNIWHYSRSFNSFRGMLDGKKHKASFNICSGLFAPVFQFYRKMDLFGIGLLLLMNLPMAIILYVGGTSEGLLYLLNLVNVAENVLLCVFGDYIYYKQAVRRIRKIRREYKGKTGTPEYYEALSDCGRPSYARAALGFLAMIFAEACILAMSAG